VDVTGAGVGVMRTLEVITVGIQVEMRMVEYEAVSTGTSGTAGVVSSPDG